MRERWLASLSALPGPGGALQAQPPCNCAATGNLLKSLFFSCGCSGCSFAPRVMCVRTCGRARAHVGGLGFLQLCNRLSISISISGLMVAAELQRGCGCNRAADRAAWRVWCGSMGIFWAADIGAARRIGAAAVCCWGGRAKVLAFSPGAAGRSGSIGSSSTRCAGMAVFCGFWPPDRGWLEGLRWKDRAKALCCGCFPVPRVCLSG